MAITFPTKYPPALTNAAWQKKKSFLDKAKSKTKTGLGDTLKKAEATWKLILWDKLRADKQPGDPKMRPFTAAKANRAAAEKVKAGPVRAAINALDAAARKARETAKNKALSAPAVKAASKLSGELVGQANLLRNISLADFDQEIKQGQREFNTLEDKYEKWIADVETRLGDLDANSTLANWKRHKKVLDETIFKGYHFTILSVDTLGMKEYASQRARWKALDQVYGTTKKAIERAGKDEGDVAVQIGHFVEVAEPIVGGLA